MIGIYQFPHWNPSRLDLPLQSPLFVLFSFLFDHLIVAFAIVLEKEIVIAFIFLQNPHDIIAIFLHACFELSCFFWLIFHPVFQWTYLFSEGLIFGFRSIDILHLLLVMLIESSKAINNWVGILQLFNNLLHQWRFFRYLNFQVLECMFEVYFAHGLLIVLIDS